MPEDGESGFIDQDVESAEPTSDFGDGALDLGSVENIKTPAFGFPSPDFKLVF